MVFGGLESGWREQDRKRVLQGVGQGKASDVPGVRHSLVKATMRVRCPQTPVKQTADCRK